MQFKDVGAEMGSMRAANEAESITVSALPKFESRDVCPIEEQYARGLAESLVGMSSEAVEHFQRQFDARKARLIIAMTRCMSQRSQRSLRQRKSLASRAIVRYGTDAEAVSTPLWGTFQYAAAGVVRQPPTIQML